MKEVLKKILNIIIDSVVILILVVSTLVVVLSLTSNSSGVPNIFGIAPLTVQSNSMEPTLNVDDLLFCKIPSDQFSGYEVGDIVTFKTDIDGEERLNTHRIIEKIPEKGITYYRTQGDNKVTNELPDKELQSDLTILAKYTGKKIPGVGAFFSFIRTQLGFFLVILLPMILFFVYEAIRVIVNIIALNKEKAIEAAKNEIANSQLTEEQKQRAIEEYLAQQKAQEENTSEVQTPAEEEITGADSESEKTNI